MSFCISWQRMQLRGGPLKASSKTFTYVHASALTPCDLRSFLQKKLAPLYDFGADTRRGGRLQVQGGAASDGVAYEGATVLEAKQVRDPGL